MILNYNLQSNSSHYTGCQWQWLHTTRFLPVSRLKIQDKKYLFSKSHSSCLKNIATNIELLPYILNVVMMKTGMA